VSAMTIAAMGLAAGTSYAEPAAPAPAASDELNVAVAPAINYKAYQNGTAAVISTDAGSLTVANGQLQIKDNAGIVIGGLPLVMQLDDMQVPIATQVQGNTATLTLDGANAVYKPVALPYQEFAPWKTPYEREQAAWSRMTSTITTGAAIGAIVGAVGAGVVGCVAGGALLAPPGALLFLAGVVPAAVLGCLTGAVAFAPVGALAGSILVGAPVAIGAAIQYFTTINEPFVPPKPAG
ncbi:MAG TPA: hypothetical protein VIW24_14335, partial [Aldersonia sp.]